MSTNRTGRGAWKNLRATTIAEAQARGQNTCPTCGTWIDYHHAGLPNSPEVDHITPRAQGGTDAPANLQVLCRSCNRSKG
ncbi:UNVERIFIED_CONTAM: HNH endonuclease, partial [Acinetobacter sp. HSTU-ASm16]